MAENVGNLTDIRNSFHYQVTKQHVKADDKEIGMIKHNLPINHTADNKELDANIDGTERKRATQRHVTSADRNIAVTPNTKTYRTTVQEKATSHEVNATDTIPEAEAPVFAVHTNETLTKDISYSAANGSGSEEKMQASFGKTRKISEYNDIRNLTTNTKNLKKAIANAQEDKDATQTNGTIKELDEQNVTTQSRIRVLAHDIIRPAKQNARKDFYNEYPVARIEGRRLTSEEQSQHHLEMHIEFENVDYNITLHDHLPPDVKFLQNNESFCQQRKVDILFYIISAPHHVVERQQVRETWANTQAFNNQTYSAVFFIGRTESLDVQSRIKQEFLTYGDVIQLDMVDTYENLTLKGIGAVKWMTAYCSNVKYVIKADDDLAVDIRHFADVINMQITPEKFNQPKFFCLYAKNAGVIRQHSSKWYVPPNLLPGLRKYPPFCLGSFYGYPGFLLPKIQNAIMLTPLFWLEDVYFTGFIVPQLQVDQLRYVNIKGVWCDTQGQYFSCTQKYKIYFDVNSKTSGLFWKKITRRYSHTP